MSNKIKSETIYRIDHLPGEEIDAGQDFDQVQSYREYDESGRLLLETAYTQDGEIADKVSHRYEAAGRLVESLIYGDDDEILERKEVIWNHDGRVAREITYYLDGSADTHEYFYDESGNLTGMQVKDDDEEVEFTERYFIEGDKVVKVERWNGNKELVFKQEDEYDGEIIKSRTLWSAEEEEPFTLVQEFNAAGQREQELRYNSRDEMIERNIYEVDEQGQIARIIEENRQRKNTTEFFYDDQGNVIRQVETDLNGNLNHEVFREYTPGGDLLKTTVETVVKPGGLKRAYSLIFKRELF